MTLCIFNVQRVSSQISDSERLGNALDYFQSGKYHEALLLFQKLDKEYNLNPRFKAYIGICYYYEWQYKEACTYLDEAIPKLGSFSPHERSVYFYADAESYFNLQLYHKAIPCYEQMLLVCYDNEKPEVLYKLGMCYMFGKDWANAHDYFTSALSYYVRYRNTPDEHARIKQIENMIKGCEEYMHQE